MKALIVDDNATSRLILQSHLKLFSFKVTLAHSGKEAIKTLEKADKEKPYELVLMDWNLPEMDGIETSNLIRKNNLIPMKPKIIMVTAHGREEAIRRAEKAGLDGFLIKPVNPSTLFEIILNAFGKAVANKTIAPDRNKNNEGGLEKIRGARLLLVENNLINQQVAKELLESYGFLIRIAENGKEAIQKVGKTGFDAVLMDLQMPEMDGYTATREIRNLKTEIRNVPIIAMTTHAMVEEMEKCLKAGMNDHASKPIDPDKLVATLVKWIKPKEISDLNKEEFIEKSAILNPKYNILEFPESLPGIDIKSSLSNVENNKELLIQLWTIFKEQYSEATNQIRDSLKSNDFKTGQRLAHTIKGSSGNLGAMELYKVAGELESEIVKSPKKDFGDILKQFENTLNQVINSVNILQSHFNKDTIPDKTTAVDL